MGLLQLGYIRPVPTAFLGRHMTYRPPTQSTPLSGHAARLFWQANCGNGVVALPIKLIRERARRQKQLQLQLLRFTCAQKLKILRRNGPVIKPWSLVRHPASPVAEQRSCLRFHSRLLNAVCAYIRAGMMAIKRITPQRKVWKLISMPSVFACLTSVTATTKLGTPFVADLRNQLQGAYPTPIVLPRRQIARQLGVSVASVNRIVKKDLQLQCLRRRRAHDLETVSIAEPLQNRQHAQNP